MLNKHLPNFLQTDAGSVQFNPNAPCRVDARNLAEMVSSFEIQQLKTRSAAPELTETAARLAQAANLYRGQFMSGFYLCGCPDFETWLLREQEQWQQWAAGVFECLSVYHGQRGNFAPAEEYLRRWLELEPWREAARQHLMRLLALSGERGAALNQYEVCRRILAEELEVEPSPETTALYEQIKQGELAPPGALDPDPSGKLAADAQPARLPLPPSPYRGLPSFAQADAPFFFGRETIAAHLFEAVQRRPLTAVVGPSGSGKSSLLFAGLLPRLSDEDWRVISLRPGARPFQALAASLVSRLKPNLADADRLTETQRLAEALREGNLSLSDAASQILGIYPPPAPASPPHQGEASKLPPVNGEIDAKRFLHQGGKKFLFVFDQFEELYTLCPHPETRRRFIDMFLSLAGEQPSSKNEPMTNDK